MTVNIKKRVTNYQEATRQQLSNCGVGLYPQPNPQHAPPSAQ